MAQTRFPQYLSQPPKVLWWDMDVFIVFAALFILAMLIGFQSLWGFVACFFLSIFAPYSYNKFKKKYPRGFFKYAMYALGLLRLEKYPDAFTEKFEE